jgi:predicted ATPase/transcriptional regulator with XRE-family HTH domain/Tfp pilus assembly protein PilF
LSRIPSEFGQLLKRHRQALGLSQRTLAQRAGIDEKSISALESGARRSPKSGSLARLVRALGLTGADARALTGAATRSAADHGPDPAPPPTALDSPVAHQPLVGREEEIVALVERLLGGTRLLTLTGPGGIGKTTLAVGVANRLVASFADGAVLVTLDPLTDAALVPTAIAGALGLDETDPTPVRGRLATHLGGRQILLLLDGFERVLGAAGLVADLLRAAPRLTILATSRERLRLRVEEVYLVEPLDPPAAAALFVARAHAVGREITPGGADAVAVDDICARLDGLPLAIELAAARCRLIPPPALLERLARRLPLLTGGPRDAPARQQTLRATIDWSHDLLVPDEQTLFRRLAVFPVGGTPLSVEAVCGPLSAPYGVLNALESLIDKCLVRLAASKHGEPRFAMLETIREYANERLQDSGEERDILRRHAEHYLRRLGTAYALVNAYDPATLGWLERESANLGATIDWTLTHRDGSMAMHAILALQNYWAWSGRYTEGRTRLRALLALPGGDPLLRIYALCGAAKLACQQGDWDEADALGEQSLALAREHGDDYQAALAINALGEVARARGNHVVAVARFEECLSGLLALLGGEASDPTLYNHIAIVLLNFGWSTAALGNQEEARILFDEALELARANADTRVTAYALHDLGRLAKSEGAGDRSRALYDESLALARRIDDRHTVALDTFLLGRIALEMGDAAGARPLLEESLALYRVLGDARQVALITADLATLPAASPASEHDNSTLDAEGEKPGG